MKEVKYANKTRILVAFEDAYRAYASALAAAISAACPRLEVATARLEALQTEVARLHPHLVICSIPNPAAAEAQEGKLSWVQLSVDPHQPSKFCLLNGRRWESLNPSLEELLGVVEETEQLLLSSSSQRSEAY